MEILIYQCFLMNAMKYVTVEEHIDKYGENVIVAKKHSRLVSVIGEVEINGKKERICQIYSGK